MYLQVRHAGRIGVRVSNFQNDLHFAMHACYSVSTGRAAGCELASIFGSIRIMLREAEGSADLLTESVVQLYLRAALVSEDAASGFKVAHAGLACLLNAVLHLEATQASLPKVTTAVLLSLLGEERPVSILHLAARILYRVCATRADASAELRNRCLATSTEPQSMILQQNFRSYQRHRKLIEVSALIAFACRYRKHANAITSCLDSIMVYQKHLTTVSRW
jgi:hypothetical protein